MCFNNISILRAVSRSVVAFRRFRRSPRSVTSLAAAERSIGGSCRSVSRAFASRIRRRSSYVLRAVRRVFTQPSFVIAPATCLLLYTGLLPRRRIVVVVVVAAAASSSSRRRRRSRLGFTMWRRALPSITVESHRRFS